MAPAVKLNLYKNRENRRPADCAARAAVFSFFREINGVRVVEKDKFLKTDAIFHYICGRIHAHIAKVPGTGGAVVLLLTLGVAKDEAVLGAVLTEPGEKLGVLKAFVEEVVIIRGKRVIVSEINGKAV